MCITIYAWLPEWATNMHVRLTVVFELNNINGCLFNLSMYGPVMD